MSEYFEVSPDKNMVRFTPLGEKYILHMYDMYLAGASVESIEEAFGMDAGVPGTETEHIEFKVIMTMGNACGIFDQYDEILAMNNMLEDVEKEIQDGTE